MALVLAMKAGQGFYIGEYRFVVSGVNSETDFTIRREDSGDVFHVTDARAVEVLPDVFISAGDRQQMLMARVAIEAPRSIRIYRQEIYEQERRKQAQLEERQSHGPRYS